MKSNLAFGTPHYGGPRRGHCNQPRHRLVFNLTLYIEQKSVSP